MSSRPRPVRGESWLSAWPEMLGFALGFLVIVIFPDTMSVGREVIVWAIFAGITIAVSVSATRILLPHLIRLRANLDPPQSWLKILWLPLVLTLALGLIVYASRFFTVSRSDDVQIPLLDYRIGFLYIVSIIAVTLAVADLSLKRQSMARLSHKMREGVHELEDLRSILNQARQDRNDLQRVFVIFGLLVFVSISGTVAYNEVLALTVSSAKLSAVTMLGFGLLIALLMAVIFGPVQMQFTRLGQELVEWVFPVPQDPAKWHDWTESQTSLKRSLGMTGGAVNTWATIFAVLSPVIAAGIASFLTLKR